MNYVNGVIPIRNYPEYDDNGTRVLYLIPETTLTKQEYESIVEYLGTNGPGWQALCLKGKYLLHSDMNPEDAKKMVLKEVEEAKAE